MMQPRMAFLAGAFALLATLPASAAGIDVVAAENFYGDLAKQVGGKAVAVTSILSNPDQDPHLFEADPSTARALKSAKVVIRNGVDYDPWMEKLLAADPSPGRAEIVAADLMGRKAGDNPHLWYDPRTMQAVAGAMAERFGAADPAGQAAFKKNAEAFDASLKPLDAKIAAMKAKYAGLPVTASEPVFGLMAERIGLDVHNKAFQMAVMHNTAPAPTDDAAVQDDLKNHKVKVMIYNAQADDQAVKRLVALAKASRIPIVGVSETEPAGQTYQAWMLGQLDALDKALSGQAS